MSKRANMQRIGSRRVSPCPSPSSPRHAAQFQQFDMTVEPSAPLRWPSISVCMIVKNEGVNLRPCLESLDDLASEVIVVDTGSTDDTVEVAKGLGARVFHFPWIDDFAAARNESLAHASKEWVFWLDADDRLDPKAVAQIKAAAASGRADAYMAMVRSEEPDGKSTVTEHTRLFRNSAGVRFTGTVHEGVYRHLVQLGLRLARTDISVHHIGYDSAEATRMKTARNLALLEKEIAADPERLDLLAYRGLARGSTGDTAGAMADMADYLARTVSQPGFGHLRFWAYSLLGRSRQATGDPTGAAETLSRALAEFPGHPYFLHQSAILHLSSGQAETAIGELLAALTALRGEVHGARPPEWWIEGLLGRGYLALGRNEEALAWAERAYDHAPDAVEATALLARLCAETGRAARATEMLSRLLLIGAELLQRGRLDAAEDAFKEALSIAPGNPKPATNLINLYRLEGRYVEATDLVRQTLERHPSDPDLLLAFGSLSLALGHKDGVIAALQLLRVSAPSHQGIAMLGESLARWAETPPGQLVHAARPAGSATATGRGR